MKRLLWPALVWLIFVVLAATCARAGDVRKQFTVVGTGATTALIIDADFKVNATPYRWDVTVNYEVVGGGVASISIYVGGHNDFRQVSGTGVYTFQKDAQVANNNGSVGGQISSGGSGGTGSFPLLWEIVTCPTVPYLYWVDNRFGTVTKNTRLIAYATGAEYIPINGGFLGEKLVAVGEAKKYEGSVQMCPGQALHLEIWNGSEWVGYDPEQGDPAPNPNDTKRLTLSIPPNPSTITIKFRLMKTLAGVTTMHSEFVQAPGASGVIQVITVPNDGASYEVVSRVEGYEFVDGQWIVAEGAVKEQSVAPSTSTNDLPDGDAPPDLTGSVTAVVPTDAPTTGVATESSGGGVWRSGSGTAAADALTNTVYREGIDKIIALAKVTTAPTMHSGDVPAPPKAAVNPLRKVGSSKIPSAPSFFTDAFPTNVSSISYTSQPITVGGRTMPGKTITYDLADHAVPVAAFRAICSGVLWVNFFFLVVWTVRGAGAGK